MGGHATFSATELCSPNSAPGPFSPGSGSSCLGCDCLVSVYLRFFVSKGARRASTLFFSARVVEQERPELRTSGDQPAAFEDALSHPPVRVVCDVTSPAFPGRASSSPDRCGVGLVLPDNRSCSNGITWVCAPHQPRTAGWVRRPAPPQPPGARPSPWCRRSSVINPPMRQAPTTTVP